MSSAHRPTWNPAEGRADERHKSARVSARHLPSHTKLKFRQPQQGGQASSLVNRNESVRRDLKKELEMAERESRNKKRKEQGLAAEEEGNDLPEMKAIEGTQGGVADVIDEEELKRRKLVEEMARLDQDEEDSDDGSASTSSDTKGKAKANANGGEKADSADSSSDSDSDSDDDDDEDDTAALLRELEKIKRERAEEKARIEQERANAEQSSREDEIALGNPLLNLENAMKGAGAGKGSSNSSNGAASFGVKRRWDDDVIFKNQASGNDKERDGFVNDLTRSDFHRRFLQRYIR